MQLVHLEHSQSKGNRYSTMMAPWHVDRNSACTAAALPAAPQKQVCLTYRKVASECLLPTIIIIIIIIIIISSSSSSRRQGCPRSTTSCPMPRDRSVQEGGTPSGGVSTKSALVAERASEVLTFALIWRPLANAAAEVGMHKTQYRCACTTCRHCEPYSPMDRGARYGNHLAVTTRDTWLEGVICM